MMRATMVSRMLTVASLLSFWVLVLQISHRPLDMSSAVW